MLHSVCWLILQKVCRYVGLSDSRSVGLLVCRSRRLLGLVVGQGGRSVCWFVGRSTDIGLQDNRSVAVNLALGLVSLSLEGLGLHCVTQGVALASFVRSWARIWGVWGSFLGALGLHFGALEVALASFLGSWG